MHTLFYSGMSFKINKSYISLKKITKFSAQKLLQGKNKDRTMVGHIKELFGLLEFHPQFGHFECVRRLGNTCASMFHVEAFALSNFYFFRPLVKFPIENSW